MKKQLLICLLCAVCHTLHAQTADEQAIRNLLAKQVAQWNNGSIDGYMHGYWENDSLQFIGRSGPRYGYKMTLQKYKEAYPDPEHMGKLSFTVVMATRLSPDYFYITGLWSLARSIGDVSGVSTMLIKKINGEWIIISDHSS